MASILDFGAGAAGGINTMLERMAQDRAARLAQAKLDEEVRSNKSTEDYRNRALDETSLLRQATMRATEADKQAGILKGNREDALRVEEQRVPGQEITPQRFDELKSLKAVPMESYQPRNYLNTGVDQGPTEEPQGYKFTGFKAKDEVAKGLQQKDYVYNGKHIVADYNPGTGAVTYNGQDIKAQAEPWVKPPAPDRTMIWTDQGAIPRSAAAAAAAGGNPVQPQDSAQTRTRRGMADQIGSHFADTFDQLDEADKAGLLGPLQGRLMTDFLAGKVGSTGDPAKDELIGQLRMNLAALSTGFSSLHGRGGAGQAQAEVLKKRFDESHMSKAEIHGALGEMQKWVNTYATKANQPVASHTSTSDKDPLGILGVGK